MSTTKQTKPRFTWESPAYAAENTRQDEVNIACVEVLAALDAALDPADMEGVDLTDFPNTIKQIKDTGIVTTVRLSIDRHFMREDAEPTSFGQWLKETAARLNRMADVVIAAEAE